MTKPTAHQLAVLRKMRDGWELGLDTGMDAYAWLQRNGLGRGGDTQSVSLNTLYALVSRKLLERGGYNYPTQRFILTAKGREAADA